MGAGIGRMADMPTSRILNMMTRQLDLTADQRAKVEGILEPVRADIKKNAEAIRKDVAKARDDVKALLTEEQKAKIGGMKQGLFEGMAGFMAAHGPEIRGELKKIGEGIRLRVAMQSLDLKPEQREKLKAAANTLNTRTREIMAKVKPELEAARAQAKSQMEEILTPEQRDQLEKRLQEMPSPGKKTEQGQKGMGAWGMKNKDGMWGRMNGAGRWHERMQGGPAMRGMWRQNMWMGRGMGMGFGPRPGMMAPWMSMHRMQRWDGVERFPGMMMHDGRGGMGRQWNDQGFGPGREKHQRQKPEFGEDDEDGGGTY